MSGEFKGGFFHASDRPALHVSFDAEIPSPSSNDHASQRVWENSWREMYRTQAQELVDTLEANLPGGLMDALLAELCRRKASIFRVASPTPKDPE